MNLNYRAVTLFFCAILLGAALLFPSEFDVVTLYRNSYLYGDALDLVNRLGSEQDQDRVALERADLLYLAGRYQETIQLLEEFTVTYPVQVEAWRRLAEVYRTLQQPQQALDALENLVAIAPADSMGLYLLDEYYRWFQMPVQAAANLEALITHFPQDYYNYEKLTYLHLGTGQQEDAIAAYQRCITVFPDSLQPQLDLGQLYLAQKDPRALPFFRDLHRSYPEQHKIVDGLVSALINAGERGETIETFRNFYRDRLEQSIYLHRLSRLYVYLGDPAEAAAVLERELALAPTIETRLQLIDFYASIQSYDLAVKHARVLVRQEPTQANFWEIYIDYLGAGLFKEQLVSALTQYVERWPDDRRMWSELADAYQWVENRQAEIDILRKLANQDPGDTALQQRLANAYLNQGSYARAASYYARLLQGDPGKPDYRQGLLWSLENMPGDPLTPDYARQLYRATGPGLPAAGLLLAQFHSDGKQPQRAAEIYQQLRRAHPDSTQLLVEMGWRLFAAGDVPQAVSYWREVLAQDKNNRRALSGLADAVLVDDPRQALDYLRLLEKIDARDVPALYRTGLAYEALADSTQMRAYYRRVLALLGNEPNPIPETLRQQAHALYRTGDLNSARRLLAAGQRAHPDHLEILNDYAEVLIALGQHQEALKVLQKVPKL